MELTPNRREMMALVLSNPVTMTTAAQYYKNRSYEATRAALMRLWHGGYIYRDGNVFHPLPNIERAIKYVGRLQGITIEDSKSFKAGYRAAIERLLTVVEKESRRTVTVQWKEEGIEE